MIAKNILCCLQLTEAENFKGIPLCQILECPLDFPVFYRVLRIQKLGAFCTGTVV